MKEDQAAVLTRVQEASTLRPQTGEAESAPAHDTATHEIHSQTSEVILFLLDLAKTTANSGFLLLAKDAAARLTCEWRDFREAFPHSGDLSFKDDLSNSAFALAEVWRVTREPAYREAGLEMIRYVRGTELVANHDFGTVPEEGRR